MFLEVFGSPEGTWNSPRLQQQLHSSFEPILDRFWLDFGRFLGVKIDHVGLRRGSEAQLEAGKKYVENYWMLRRAAKWHGFTRRPPESPGKPQREIGAGGVP